LGWVREGNIKFGMSKNVNYILETIESIVVRYLSFPKDLLNSVVPNFVINLGIKTKKIISFSTFYQKKRQYVIDT